MRFENNILADLDSSIYFKLGCEVAPVHEEPELDAAEAAPNVQLGVVLIHG
jgi:hypothetical protein